MELKDTIELMQSADYKDRFKAEYFQVAIRLQKLDDMLKKWEAGTLEFQPTCTKQVLWAQYSNMLANLSMLEHRAKLEGIELSEDE